MEIVVPKRYGVILPTDILVFLAGPVQGGGDWQRFLIEHFMNVSIKEKWSHSFCESVLPRIKFVVPCRWTDDHPLAEYFVTKYELLSGQKSDPRFSQTAWEVHYYRYILNSGGLVVFGLFPESKENPRTDGSPYARDTYGELGRITTLPRNKGKVFIGAHSDFPGMETIYKNLRLALDLDFVTNNFKSVFTAENLADHIAEILFRK